ncbi:flagellar motor protein [Massilia sp. Dwa41.01b]|uniref:flagellar motor protein n=1 Tax=unclassified Massilia TaxID=2609279 RepID=UPI0015FF63B3|nr:MULTISPECIES: flagellar motor protein [unclassified Massilia]QNA90103.1 flagellar motor protein [Massilia sp. Dwa41.01b]QNB00993.1 flagellar motor protein [Massilia sp. Se16.2.3]
MDFASLIGLALAIIGLVVGHTLDGGRFASLIQPAAFAIVVVGTFGAVLLQSEARTFRRGMQMLRWVFFPPKDKRQPLSREIALWSHTARRDGLLALEQYMGGKEPFIQKGLRLVVDGVHPDKLRGLLETEVSAFEAAERRAARIWESAAGYAPTIGILGAVLGLIHVMENLSDPSRLGSGIAVAFVSTVYGVGLANLFFLPVANKLKALVADRVAQYDILLEVFHDLASGNHARVVEERMASLLVTH